MGDQGEVAEVLLTMEGVQVGIWAEFRGRAQRKSRLKLLSLEFGILLGVHCCAQWRSEHSVLS